MTAAEYRRVDEAHTGDMAEAMERAGHAVALAASRHGAGYGKRVVVLAGPGNNGGDGYVAARHLVARGASVEVHRLAEPTTELARRAALAARSQGVRVVPIGDPVPCDLMVDAVFGGGGRSGLPDEVVAWMGAAGPVIAVDFPTGLDPDTGRVDSSAFRAVETVTFGALKTGHVIGVGPEHCGQVTVTDIGIHGGSPVMFIAEESDTERPGRHRKAHKWSGGAVLIVGGSEGMVGAAILAARAALNFGAGAVYLWSPGGPDAILTAPEIPFLRYEEDRERLSRFDTLVVGPGLSARDAKAVVPLVESARSVVLDAGGLTSDLLDVVTSTSDEVVITPHGGEFKRIAGVGGGQFAVRALARSRGVTVLLKGNPTLISDGGPPILVTTGGPELATIGTGDVLAGMIGALMARGLDATAAAMSGAYWHGKAASSLAATGTVTARRLVDSVGRYAW
jgi:ADP-dependent NAD(P)H-hydrate dehydratase / NAD(P)H-hydrate epimerase